MEKVKLFVISVIALTLMLSLVSAQEVIEPTESFDFISWLGSLFVTDTFSIVGDSRQCGPGVEDTFYVAPGESFEHYVYQSNCAAGVGLYNVFSWSSSINAYKPYKEYPNGLSISSSSSNTHDLIVELYCCPHPECQADSQCENWYGQGSECITQTANDPFIPYQFDTFKSCTEPTVGCNEPDLTCWRISGNECQSTTWDCSMSPYQANYPDCPSSWPYGSSNSCENDLTVNGGECSDYNTQSACNSDSNCEFDIGVYECKEKSANGNGDSCVASGDGCFLQSDCCSGLVCGGGFIGVGKTCKVEGNGDNDGNGDIETRKIFSKDELKFKSSVELLEGICTTSSDCTSTDSNSSCNIVSGLIGGNFLSEDTMSAMRKDFCGGDWLSWIFGADYEQWKTCTSLTGKDSYFKSHFGVCIKGEVGESNFLDSLAFIDIDGDGDKDSVDAIIILVIAIMGLLLISKMMIYGRFEYEE